MPWVRARSIPSSTARWVTTWPMPWLPVEHDHGAAVADHLRARSRAAIAPDRSRVTYQGSRSIPCEA